jgi:pimeloyl-ACP methyl ester carboxylesterase
MGGMARWIRRAVLALAALALTAVLAGAAVQAFLTRRDLARVPPPGRLVDVGGHRLHIWCTGRGDTPVVLEAGLGGSTADWGYVQPEVAAFTRVCSYDRAGMGYSDAGPSPRTARRIAGELDRLLEASGIDRPAVLVGASIGGLFARMLATEHPRRAAGLVLVDASHEDQPVEIPRVAPVLPWIAATGAARLAGFSLGLPSDAVAPAVRGHARAVSFRTSGYRTAVDELTHLTDTAAEIRATRRALDIAVLVLTAGRGSGDAWQRLQRDQLALSRRACQAVAERSGHAVPVGQPEIVVDAIRATVAAAGTLDGTPCERMPAGTPGGGTP